MDQQRWLAQFSEESWRVIAATKSPARKRAEMAAIRDRMGKHRATYIQIEHAQFWLGLSTMEGQNYG
jgi:hypothetical protein